MPPSASCERRAQLPALRVGGRYQARVLTLMADGRLRLAVGERTVTARCEAAVKEGETVTVEVERLWPVVVLRVLRQ